MSVMIFWMSAELAPRNSRKTWTSLMCVSHMVVLIATEVWAGMINGPGCGGNPKVVGRTKEYCAVVRTKIICLLVPDLRWE